MFFIKIKYYLYKAKLIQLTTSLLVSCVFWSPDCTASSTHEEETVIEWGKNVGTIYSRTNPQSMCMLNDPEIKKMGLKCDTSLHPQCHVSFENPTSLSALENAKSKLSTIFMGVNYFSVTREGQRSMMMPLLIKTLSNYPLDQLTDLYLDRCGITSLESFVFLKVPKLGVLSLNGNHITHVSPLRKFFGRKTGGLSVFLDKNPFVELKKLGEWAVNDYLMLFLSEKFMTNKNPQRYFQAKISPTVNAEFKKVVHPKKYR